MYMIEALFGIFLVFLQHQTVKKRYDIEFKK